MPKPPRFNLRVTLFTSPDKYRRAMVADEMHLALKAVLADTFWRELKGTTQTSVRDALTKAEVRDD